MFSSRWFLLKSQTANRTTAWSCFPVPWLIIAFQSEYLPETGLRSLCAATFPPCCLSPHVAENVPYISEQWCAVKFASVYTLSNCSVPWGCWGLRDRKKKWQGKGCSDYRNLYVHWDKNTLYGVCSDGNPHLIQQRFNGDWKKKLHTGYMPSVPHLLKCAIFLMSMPDISFVL